MKIRMKIQITGWRDGVRWPAPGGEIDLPDREAAKLCDAGFAIPVAEKDADIEERGKRPAKRAASRPKSDD